MLFLLISLLFLLPCKASISTFICCSRNKSKFSFVYYDDYSSISRTMFAFPECSIKPTYFVFKDIIGPHKEYYRELTFEYIWKNASIAQKTKWIFNDWFLYAKSECLFYNITICLLINTLILSYLINKIYYYED